MIEEITYQLWNLDLDKNYKNIIRNDVIFNTKKSIERMVRNRSWKNDEHVF